MTRLIIELENFLSPYLKQTSPSRKIQNIKTLKSFSSAFH